VECTDKNKHIKELNQQIEELVENSDKLLEEIKLSKKIDPETGL
jgi:hypothetical protein